MKLRVAIQVHIVKYIQLQPNCQMQTAVDEQSMMVISVVFLYTKLF